MQQQQMFPDVTWNWREYFSRQLLSLGESDEKNGYVDIFQSSPDGKSASCITIRGFHADVRRAPTTPEELADYPDWNLLRGGMYNEGRPDYYDNYYSCDCSQGEKGMLCRHVASLMFHWEKVHGPFVMKETPAQKANRIAAAARETLIQSKKALKLPAADYFKIQDPLPKNTYFNTDRILNGKGLETSQYETEQADQYLAENTENNFTLRQGYTRDGQQALELNDSVGGKKLHAVLVRSDLLEFTCRCGELRLHAQYSGYGRPPLPPHLCFHGLVAWSHLRTIVAKFNPGDLTDGSGFNLLSMLAGAVMEEKDADPDQEETAAETLVPDVVLTPRIVQSRYSREMTLSFDITRSGERPYLLKNFFELVNAAEGKGNLALGKKLTLSFSLETFTENSLPWYQEIKSRVEMYRSLDDSFRYYLPSEAKGSLALNPVMLDRFYDLAEGMTVTLQHDGRNNTTLVRIRDAEPKATVKLSPSLTGSHLSAIIVTGRIPSLLQGAKYQYILDDFIFGRVSGEGMNYLRPFARIAGRNGEFRCVIGEKKFPEFAFRVLPALSQSPQIDLENNVGPLLDTVLPPEPEFTFYMDLDSQWITCSVIVRYGDKSIPLGFYPIATDAFPRDMDQEDRVLTEVNSFFAKGNPEKKRFELPAGDDNLIRVKTEGVAALSRYGIVKGSDAFSRISVRPSPQTGLSIRLESDLLDLSIQTKDLTREELLDLLTSYRQRKRWHRLRGGDFVDLRNPESLREMDQALQSMNLSMEALLKGEVHLPKYRALYVDKLLENHEELAASRDREFKSLIRSFQTIRDSDFEVPDQLEDQLRPYQLYGFRWLSTLSRFGFGGILADEMGLGKTLQMLTWMLAQKKAGESGAFLVVCPASLVYNWGEECRKFTPELKSMPIDGSLAQRKAIYEGITKKAADLYIISYDLLKRDIELYHSLHFSAVVLDEAQYIKNQKANVSKAVRILKADHRFALTGTPIENRLAELWSIFDFLMPGFLYTSSEFSTRFETPIMKQKNPEITLQLSRMTEPFILRRKKTDVLKDLPEKLEEVRSADMKEDQRKLYDAQVVHMKEVLASSTDDNEDKMRILAEITRLRQICCDPSLIFENYHGTSAKRAACLDLIQSAIDGGHRMLVFSQFTSMLDLLAADLKKEAIPFFTITGATPKQERLRLVNEFNAGDTPVFLISLKAGGTGLNLTGADVVIHYDPWWNLAVQNQATDRAHRIGQTRQVTVMKLIAAESIEEKIVELQEAKRELADAIIGGQTNSLMSLSREELLALIE